MVALVPIKETVAPAENKEPKMTNVAFPDNVLSTNVEVVCEPPFTLKVVIVGGASIDFHSVPL